MENKSTDKPSGTVCRHCGKPEKEHYTVKRYCLFSHGQPLTDNTFQPAPAEQPRQTHLPSCPNYGHLLVSECGFCKTMAAQSVPVAASPAEGPRQWDCPVCYWPHLKENPELLTYEICPRCGVEFGYEPKEVYHLIRAKWEAEGRPFWRSSTEKREMWDSIHQCFAAQPVPDAKVEEIAAEIALADIRHWSRIPPYDKEHREIYDKGLAESIEKIVVILRPYFPDALTLKTFNPEDHLGSAEPPQPVVSPGLAEEATQGMGRIRQTYKPLSTPASAPEGAAPPDIQAAIDHLTLWEIKGNPHSDIARHSAVLIPAYQRAVGEVAELRAKLEWVSMVTPPEITGWYWTFPRNDEDPLTGTSLPYALRYYMANEDGNNFMGGKPMRGWCAKGEIKYWLKLPELPVAALDTQSLGDGQ